MGKQGRRCKQLLDDLKEMRGCWKLKEEALYYTVWSTRCGRGYGPVMRHYRMNASGSVALYSDLYIIL